MLGRDRKAFTQFQTACHDVIDDNDRALVAVVRDAERKKMPVGAANPGAQTMMQPPPLAAAQPSQPAY